VSLSEEFCRTNGLSSQNCVKITVSDDGCGIPSELLSQIFEPFFTTKPEELGTGLGLAIVHDAVLQNEGAIEVVSNVGSGSSFNIYFARTEVKPSEAPVNPMLVGLPRGTETVLLVEDAEVVRVLWRTVLGELGYNVSDFPSGQDLLVNRQQLPETVDLLVADIVLPGMSGPLLAHTLLRERPDLKVLLTSGHGEPLPGALEHEGGAFAFLHKPCSLGAFAQRVREVLDGGGRASSPRSA
jgi:CheY-like chemotaxis protein